MHSFARRAVLVAAAAAMLVPQPAASDATVSILQRGDGCYFEGGAVKTALGSRATWENDTDLGRLVVQREGFWSLRVEVNASESARMRAAGRFLSRLTATSTTAASPCPCGHRDGAATRPSG